MTLHEATEKFVREMDAIPTEMIERLWEQSPDEWEEVTVPDGVIEPYGVFPCGARCGRFMIALMTGGLRNATAFG